MDVDLYLRLQGHENTKILGLSLLQSFEEVRMSIGMVLVRMITMDTISLGSSQESRQKKK